MAKGGIYGIGSTVVFYDFLMVVLLFSLNLTHRDFLVQMFQKIIGAILERSF